MPTTCQWRLSDTCVPLLTEGYATLWDIGQKTYISECPCHPVAQPANLGNLLKMKKIGSAISTENSRNYASESLSDNVYGRIWGRRRSTWWRKNRLWARFPVQIMSKTRCAASKLFAAFLSKTGLQAYTMSAFFEFLNLACVSNHWLLVCVQFWCCFI